MEPVHVAQGILLKDEVTSLESLVRPTAEYLRNRGRGYLPLSVLYY